MKLVKDNFRQIFNFPIFRKNIRNTMYVQNFIFHNFLVKDLQNTEVTGRLFRT